MKAGGDMGGRSTGAAWSFHSFYVGRAAAANATNTLDDAIWPR